MTSATLWTEAKRLQGIEISLIRQVVNSAPPNAINLALGELSFPLPEHLKQAAIETINNGTAVYTPNAGLPTLRIAVADYYADATTPEQICICNGAEEAVYLCLLSLLNSGDLVAIPDPDYSAYPAIAIMMGAKVIRLPLQGDLKSIDWQLWEALLSDEIKVLLLSLPSNPCGFCLGVEDATRLSELCHNRGIIVIVDEIYRHLFINTAPYGLEEHPHNLIRIGGLSKSHCMSGWRIGWVNAPLELAPSVIKAKQYVSTCAPWLSQKLAEVALSPEGWAAAEGIRTHLVANQALALDILSDVKHDILIPQAGPYLMLRIPGGDLDFARKAASKGVICVPGTAFGKVAEGWIRVNIAVEEGILAKGLELIKGLL